MTQLKRRFGWTVLLLTAAAAVARAGAAKTEQQVLPVGAPAPAYALPDQNGIVHTLASDKGKVVLMAFYPADFTGGCTLEAHSLSGANKQLQALGVQVYGVSVQDPRSHKQFCTKEGIPYTLLADTQKVMTRAYGVLMPVGGGLASRVTYIVGRDGHIVYVDSNVNGHLTTCGPDWVTWLKAHPEVTRSPHRSAEASAALHLTALTAAQTAPKTAALGQPAPDFTLPDVTTGASTGLAALSQGKTATVILFIATRCPYSNGYNDRMVALARTYAARGVAFAGINANTNEPVKECRDHARQHGFPFPVLKDAADRVADAYDAHVTPEAYVLNARGILVYHGRIDNSVDPDAVKTHDLADALDATLANRSVARPRTKAFGCSIKRG